jgi:photosystem II stability/assembly factor-like uncharacterized protein
MKVKLLILIFAVSLVQAQTGWFMQNSGTNINLRDVQFISPTTGFICGDAGAFLSTTNSGVNWTLRQSGLGNLTDLQFLSGTIGFVSGDSGISKTTNGGNNWTRIYSGIDGAYIHFVDQNTGYKITYSFSKTTNGGANWQQTFAFPPGGTTRLIYLDGSNMYCTGWDWIMHFGGLYSAKIFKSVNGGANWNVQYSSNTDACCSYVKDINFQGTDGFAVGHERVLNFFYRSSNSGINWAKISIPVEMNTVYFTSTNKGWLAGVNGMIYYTTNSGAGFNTQSSGTNVQLNRICMVNELTGWIVGNGGVILSTTNGGITGLVSISSELPSEFGLSQNYPNPFNPMTKLKFQIPKSGLAVLTVYDALGKVVQVLVNQQLSPGSYEVDFDGSNLPSGVYYYSLEASAPLGGAFSETKKMVLIK